MALKRNEFRRKIHDHSFFKDPRLIWLEYFIELFADEDELDFELFKEFYIELFKQPNLPNNLPPLINPRQLVYKQNLGFIIGFNTLGAVFVAAGAALLLSSIFLPLGIAAITVGSTLIEAGTKEFFPSLNWKASHLKPLQSLIDRRGFGFSFLLMGLGIASLATGFLAPMGIAALAIGSFLLSKKVVQTHQKKVDRKSKINEAMWGIKENAADPAKSEKIKSSFDIFRGFFGIKLAIDKAYPLLISNPKPNLLNPNVLNPNSLKPKKAVGDLKAPLTAKDLSEDVLWNIASYTDGSACRFFYESAKRGQLESARQQRAIKTEDNLIALEKLEKDFPEIKQPLADIAPFVTNAVKLSSVLARRKLEKGNLDNMQAWELACLNGNPRLLKQIHEQGQLNLNNQRNVYDEKPLHIAAFAGSIACMEYLIKYVGMNPRQATPSGQYLLHFANLSNNKAAIEYVNKELNILYVDVAAQQEAEERERLERLVRIFYIR